MFGNSETWDPLSTSSEPVSPLWFWVLTTALTSGDDPNYCEVDALDEYETMLLKQALNKVVSGWGPAMVDRTVLDIKDDELDTLGKTLPRDLIDRIREVNSQRACLDRFDHFPVLKDPRAPLKRESVWLGLESHQNEWFRRLRRHGVIEFSRAAISSDRSRALIVVSHNRFGAKRRTKKPAYEVRTLNFVLFSCNGGRCSIDKIVKHTRKGYRLDMLL